ncbi:MAG: hypothetical protein QXT46_00490 [Pyrobaculum sp.]
MAKCARWERLIAWAEKSGNTQKTLEFKEKLVECVVYTALEKVKKGRIKEAEELLKYGREVAKELGIEELFFHISLIEKEISKKKEKRKAPQIK